MRVGEASHCPVELVNMNSASGTSRKDDDDGQPREVDTTELSLDRQPAPTARTDTQRKAYATRRYRPLELGRRDENRDGASIIISTLVARLLHSLNSHPVLHRPQ